MKYYPKEIIEYNSPPGTQTGNTKGPGVQEKIPGNDGGYSSPVYFT